MAKRLWVVLALGMVPAGTRQALADVWDTATINDDSDATTLNELVHGAEQVHDLADLVAGTTADEDWYQVLGGPLSSYEAIVDGATGDIANTGGNGGMVMELYYFGAGLAQTGNAVGLGFAQHLAWDDTALPLHGALRVHSLGCPGCTVEDQYRIRFFDTTCNIPRFNNSATQVTILVLQNATPSYGIPPFTDVHGHYWMLDVNGTIQNPVANLFQLGPGGFFVQNTSFVAPPGAGSIVITNDAGYGAVTGKAVAVEPATGFTFDTAMTCRPH